MEPEQRVAGWIAGLETKAWTGYAVAVGGTAVAAAARWAIGEWVGEVPPFITFYPVVIVAAVRGGTRAGILASVLGGLVADFFLIPPIGRPWPLTAGHLAGMAIFIAINIALSIVGGRLRAAYAQSRVQAAALASAANAIVITDLKGVIRWVNPAFEHLTGYSAAEAVGQNPRVLKSDKQDQAFFKQMRQTIQAGHVWHGELVNKRKDGSLYDEEMTITPVQNAHGVITHFIAVKLDITGRKQAETALRESEERFRLLTEGVKDYAIYMLDPEGRVATWNSGAQRVKGYTAPEILGQSFARFYLPEDVAAGKPRHVLAMAAEQGHYTAEDWRRRKDGSPFWASVTITALRDAAGQLCGFGKVTHDLTERKLAEEELQRRALETPRQKELLAVTLASIGDGVIVTDIQARVTFLNAAAEHLTGWTSPEASGQPLPAIFNIVFRDVTRRRQAEAMLHEQAQLAQLRADAVQALQQPGTMQALLQSVAALLVERLDAAFARVWTLDPTGQILELEASAGLYTHLNGAHDRVPVGQFKIGRIAQERRSLVTNQVIGDPYVPNQDWARREGLVAFAGFPLLLEERLLGVVALFARHALSPAAVETFHALAGALELMLSAGVRAVVCSPLVASSGRVVGVLSAHFDTRHQPAERDLRLLDLLASQAADFIERRKAEEELRSAREDLARANADLERRVQERTAKLREAMEEQEGFSYSIVHDMRAPLRAMQNFATLAQETCATCPQKEGLDYFRRIRTASHRLDRLITDALNYSKVVREELAVLPVDAGKLLRGIVETYPDFQPAAAEIRIEFEALMVLGNEAALTQAFSNLLGNAVKFVAPGIKPCVRVWAEEVQSPAPESRSRGSGGEGPRARAEHHAPRPTPPPINPPTCRATAKPRPPHQSTNPSPHPVRSFASGSKIMASGSQKRRTRKSLACSNACIGRRNTPARASAWPSSAEPWNGWEAAWGWSRSPGEAAGSGSNWPKRMTVSHRRPNICWHMVSQHEGLI